MDIWHRLGRVFRASNIGVLIFFLLNLSLIMLLFFPYGVTLEQGTLLSCCYLATVLLSFSPLGEWVLATLAGAKEIKRKDFKLKLIPLLEITFQQAKCKTPDMVDSIHLKIIPDPNPNAFAIGRKTICVTEGLLNLSDQEIMSVFAHELGHLAYRHSELQLLIGGGNLFITSFLMFVKIICWMITGTFTAVALGSRNIGRGILLTFIGSLSTILIWLWTKFCLLFLRWSMRQNEYIADEYALSLGYGDVLAGVIDCYFRTYPKSGLLKALYSTHPDSDNRIARLQDLGASYGRYWP